MLNKSLHRIPTLCVGIPKFDTSFPHSAWECIPTSAYSMLSELMPLIHSPRLGILRWADFSNSIRHRMHSHAERGNEKYTMNKKMNVATRSHALRGNAYPTELIETYSKCIK